MFIKKMLSVNSLILLFYQAIVFYTTFPDRNQPCTLKCIIKGLHVGSLTNYFCPGNFEKVILQRA